MNNARTVIASLLLLAPVVASPAPAPVALPAPSSLASGTAPPDPAQLRELRSRYAQWQSLPESERARVREAAHRMASLPPEQQQSVRATFHAQDARFRDGWRLGPALGAQYPKLQGLFGFVPAEQRDAALAALRQLSVDQLAQLTLVAQRTPPQERDQVRSDFLKLAPAERDRWLREHVVR
jgi:hypothetical protein